MSEQTKRPFCKRRRRERGGKTEGGESRDGIWFDSEPNIIIWAIEKLVLPISKVPWLSIIKFSSLCCTRYIRLYINLFWLDIWLSNTKNICHLLGKGRKKPEGRGGGGWRAGKGDSTHSDYQRNKKKCWAKFTWEEVLLKRSLINGCVFLIKPAKRGRS